MKDIPSKSKKSIPKNIGKATMTKLSIITQRDIKPALLHPSQAELLEEVHTGVRLELSSVGGGVSGDGVALTATVLVVWKQFSHTGNWTQCLISVIPLS